MGRQLELGLPPPPGKHGGARTGAGRPRKAEKDRKVMAHRTRRSHRKDDPVHVTLRVTKRLPSLRRQVLTAIVKRALLKQREDLAEKGATHFQLVHFSIQDDHVHLIVEAPNKRGIARGVAGLEVRIARRINTALGRKGRFWAERYHRRDLRTPTETRNVLRYVLLNARKHTRDTTSSAVADPASSASTFDGFARAPLPAGNTLPWPRVDPRTWLLRVGWRRRGLIDPADTPGPLAPRFPPWGP